MYILSLVSPLRQQTYNIVPMESGSKTSIEESSCNSSSITPAGGGGEKKLAAPLTPSAVELTEAESKKLPSSQYKGVVTQPNGRWGAQIYEKHQRVWLGTYSDEADAARAYDVAAQRFRGRDAVTNFKHLSEHDGGGADAEARFLDAHSKAEIVDMLRKHTYLDELNHSRRSQRAHVAGHHPISLDDSSPKSARVQLFDKVVTPSDVGKLNRLVIPKQHAEKHFLLQIGSACRGVLLNFKDSYGKVWRFRYSYWNSSQSYVLTKGWSRFVKEKNLKAGDVVTFSKSTGDDMQLYIDWKRRSCNLGASTSSPAGQQVVRLFGVDIFGIPAAGVEEGAGCSSGSKRASGMDHHFVGVAHCKKQCITAL